MTLKLILFTQFIRPLGSNVKPPKFSPLPVLSILLVDTTESTTFSLVNSVSKNCTSVSLSTCGTNSGCIFRANKSSQFNTEKKRWDWISRQSLDPCPSLSSGCSFKRPRNKSLALLEGKKKWKTGEKKMSNVSTPQQWTVLHCWGHLLVGYKARYA